MARLYLRDLHYTDTEASMPSTTPPRTSPSVLLLDERAAADALGLQPRTLQEWRRRGGGPPYVRISQRCIRYRDQDLAEWAEERIRTSTSDPGTDR